MHIDSLESSEDAELASCACLCCLLFLFFAVLRSCSLGFCGIWQELSRAEFSVPRSVQERFVIQSIVIELTVINHYTSGGEKNRTKKRQVCVRIEESMFEEMEQVREKQVFLLVSR